MKKFLLIEHGGIRKEFIFKKIQKYEGIEIFLVTQKIEDWILEYVKLENIILVDTQNVKLVLEEISNYMLCNDLKFDFSGSFLETFIFESSVISDTFGFHNIKPGSVSKSSRNKILMRDFCNKNNIEMPKFQVSNIKNENDFRSKINMVGFPCILKPVSGWLSAGVIKLNSMEDFDLEFNKLNLKTNASNNEIFATFGGSYLIEEYLEGNLMSIDGVISKGIVNILGMVEFLMGPEPLFVQEANFIPARVSDEIFLRCSDYVNKIISVLEFDNCGFHCELRINSSGIPKLVEIGCRLPGGPLIEGYEKALGVDLIDIMIDIWQGNDITLDIKVKNYILQKAYFDKNQGTIEDINYDISHPNLYNLVPILNKGEVVPNYSEEQTPLYFYEILANSHDELEIISKEIELKIAHKII